MKLIEILFQFSFGILQSFARHQQNIINSKLNHFEDKINQQTKSIKYLTCKKFFFVNSNINNISMKVGKKIICLFDVDGTLTKPRNEIQKNMLDCLEKLRGVADIAYVGGSDFNKIKQQLTQEGLDKGKYVFSENGLLAFENNEVIGRQNISNFLGEDKLQAFINFCLKYLSEIKIPIKRGTFIEFRTGMLNISPIGRNCSQKERDEFQIYDKEHQIRKKFIDVLKKQFESFGLMYSIGGQISFDVVPKGWDKTYCLRFLGDYEQIYFFGDKTAPGGNDHEIYEHFKPLERSFSVDGPETTMKILHQKFLKEIID